MHMHEDKKSDGVSPIYKLIHSTEKNPVTKSITDTAAGLTARFTVVTHRILDCKLVKLSFSLTTLRVGFVSRFGK